VASSFAADSHQPERKKRNLNHAHTPPLTSLW
jgi:hypothetical protein